MRQKKVVQLELDFYVSPQLVVKDNVNENGDVVCEVVSLSREEKVEAAKPGSSPDGFLMTETRAFLPEFENRFDIMDKTAIAIGKVEGLQEMKEKFAKQEEV